VVSHELHHPTKVLSNGLTNLVSSFWPPSKSSTRSTPSALFASARRESPELSAVARPISIGLIRLAFLAPEIVEAIIEGNHPPDLTAQTLITRRIELPLSWQAQKTALQF
jgi:hypothetical protein